MISHLLYNNYIEFKVDQDEITGFNYNALREYVNKELLNVDTYNIIIFDMKKVRYLDSSGVSFLLNIKKKLGKEMILKNCNMSIKKIFEVLNLEEMFEFIEV